MKPTITGPAGRLALAMGVVAGAWLIPSVSISGGHDAGPAAATPGAGLVHLAQAEAEPADAPVSYTSEQADRGEERYATDCEECHGDDLRGGLNGGAPLRGVSFEQKYGEGAPASWMFEFMSSAMPPNAPGRYSPDTYADLMAYILQRNGYQPGAALPSDVEALDHLIMEK